ncbi:hypothetical protein [Sulfuriferula sp. AH1]|uniref:hypothetical protein n=1 Tax=Sulfuriferula sp. AH1 TaxID=1985873 RepID=UPI0012F91710|nr:hypothetical protein [Sulfuriferula sp. AH1]
MTVRTDVTIPATVVLLAAGGDARIALDAEDGRNKYGCRVYPDAALIAFGSSTASVISEQGFAAADRLRDELARNAAIEPPAVSYARKLDAMRMELAALCGIADLPGLEIVFAASGTDSHLIAAQLMCQQGPLCAIMVEEGETGRGVPAALAGRHFSTRTALSRNVAEGDAIANDEIAVVTIAMRLADGTPRAVEAMDAEVAARVHEAVAAGQRVLLTLVDVSKTGMIMPGTVCVSALHRQYPGQVEVLVDACQFRIAPSTLRAYLQQGFMVAVTGSKFITGPTFSGALLVPSPVTECMQRHAVPSSLRAYSAPADWSSGWNTAKLDAEGANYGLLLRWEAALTELRLFRAIPERDVGSFLQAFAAAVLQKLDSDPAFEALPVPELNRAPISDGTSWDSLPTIFPFLLYRVRATGTRQPLDCDEMMCIYQLLQCDLSVDARLFAVTAGNPLLASRVQLGQPVDYGVRDGVPVSALRLNVSARLIVEALSPQGPGAAIVIGRALAALDKIALLLHANPV